MIPLAIAALGPYEGFVGVMGTQMGKTDFALNIMGQRLDDDAVPLIYVAPSRHFAENKFEPRLVAMIDSAPTLASRMLRGKKATKTQKRICGVTVSLAWSGSASSLAGDPAGLVLVDERDRMTADVGNEGDPVELANARHETYQDGKTGVFSTPTSGTVKVETNEETGLEHWAVSDPAKLGSPTWVLWQNGTRHEWFVPCPHCAEYFSPRFRLLSWPDDLGPGELTDDNVMLACPHCGGLIAEEHKLAMNALGRAVAPGQWVQRGEVLGDGPVSDWYSLWVSGLCSPWRSWTVAARRYVRAAREGSSEKLQAVINTCFGELWAVSGEAPPSEDVEALRAEYALGVAPAGSYRLVMGVDVQKNRLVYVVRAISRHQHMESWLVAHGEIFGETNEGEVWKALEEFRKREYSGLRIQRCFIDQKYRSQYVFSFCRKAALWAFPAAGRLPRTQTPDTETPLYTSQIEVDHAGKKLPKGRGLTRWTFNTDFFKRWIHDRIALGPDAAGAFHIAIDTEAEYCEQLVAEARAVMPSGRIVWIRLRRDNHYLDCEAMALACAYSLGLQHYAEPKATTEEPKPTPPPTSSSPGGYRPQGFKRGGRNWTTRK